MEDTDHDPRTGVTRNVLRQRRPRTMNGPQGFDFSLRQEPDPGVVEARQERTRAIFLGKVLVNAGSWRIAKEIASSCSENDGWEAEGLRGLWNPEGGAHGTLRLWAAGYATHSDGARMLGLPNGPEGADIESLHAWEVEINRSSDGSMYLTWSRNGEEAADAILSDPRIGFEDAMLARGGRLLSVAEGRVGFLKQRLPDDYDHREAGRIAMDELRERDRRRWNEAASRVARSGKGGGNGMPAGPDVMRSAMDVLRRLRATGHCPPPVVEISPNGEILLEWRGTGHLARMEFHVGARMVGHVVLDNRARWFIDEERPTDRELREFTSLVEMMRERRYASIDKALRER